jgi:meromycolic acid enoyl-[acyl-carrier-protein] reductase
MLLEGKNILITGLRNEQSLALGVARAVQLHGGEVLLAVNGRVRDQAEVAAASLPRPAPMVTWDVTVAEELPAMHRALADHWDRVDGALHAVAFAPRPCLGGDMLRAGWDDVGLAINTSAYSLKTVTEAVLPLMGSNGGSIVALTRDTRMAWAGYNWMGVAKAALESTARYLARDLGHRRIRINLVEPGFSATAAATGIPGVHKDAKITRAPLGWDPSDPTPVGDACVVLFSDLMRATTGDTLHVDGGAHFNLDPVQAPSDLA